ncbi:hypothetical protein ES332_D10G191500v1 [Gossypium tomentosum]|uniref:Leucine-rich repeat-containing N-terminal plant-type domain-containing protein n=1 Tax=Gossypium tomentosum TaxID=34277 RepID=A0A5D2J690_GOSTO|nr:hypothetical protein ES332_D10G191500v1 [Gossypium tomentosum]
MSVLLVLLFLSLATVNINEGCIESERQALFMFKHDVTDGANRLSSWSLHHGHGDCCQWDGVVCDNVTAHVLELHLANPRPLLDDYGSDAENEATERSKLRDCWLNWQNLQVIKLSNNRLNGSIPSSMGTLQSIVSLHLQKNHLSGEIPLSLNNCTDLILLDAGENELHGSIPRWIGDSLRKLVVLSLRSNKFSGYIPDELCTIGSLQVLDLADNNIIGSIPRCVSKFRAMANFNGSMGTAISYVIGAGTFVATIVMKGQMLEYGTNLNLVRSIDLSNNKLSGEIPVEVTSLFELKTLNLSHNLLSGTIPDRIGELRSLESIDFSVNKFSGSIPESMSYLTFLSHLNLSFNNLSGVIPSSTQLQSFDSSCYEGNQLCGLPVPNMCPENGTIHGVGHGGGNDNENETDRFWFGLVVGFVISFWIVFGPLVFDKRWRSIYTLFGSQTNVENH